MKPHIITIFGEYLGRLVSQRLIDNEQIELIFAKHKILELIPLSDKKPEDILKIYKELFNKYKDDRNVGFFISAIKIRIDSKRINPSDILPCLPSNSEVIILLRDPHWNKVPLEALGVPSNYLKTISKYYTLYNAAMRTYNYLIADIDKLSQEAIRYAEYARSLESRLTELNNLLIEYQKAVVDLNTKLKSFISSIQSYQAYAQIKENESNMWLEKYMELMNKLPELLDVSSKVIELSKKLATVELEKELDVDVLRGEISMLSNRIEELTKDLSLLKSKLETGTKSEQETIEKEEEKEEEEKPEKPE